MKFAQSAKMYVALLGLVAQGLLAEATFLPTPVLYGVKVVAIVATAFGVWKVTNVPDDPPAPAWKSAGPAWDEPYDTSYAGEMDDYFDKYYTGG